jgi:signal transduction histidine kinase
VPAPRLFKTASFRLSALYGTVFAVCFAILLFTTYWTATGALRDQIRTKVAEDLQALATEAQSDGAASVAQDIGERLKAGGGGTGFYYLADRQGIRLAGNLDLADQRDGWQEGDFSEAVAESLNAKADEDHQLWGAGAHLSDGSYLFVGQDAFRVLSAQEAIIEAFAWSAGIAFLLAALAGIAVSQGFLKRIDAINTTSLAIIDGRLKERIPVRGTSDEIDRLSMNLNRLFDSNQSLMESLKQVSTSIAHDLRTPLSRLRQGLEAARMTGNGAKGYEAAVEGAIAESDQLLATFAALLRIAQIESGTRRAGFKTVDLTGLFARVADAYRAVAEDGGKALDVRLAEDIAFHGDSELLLQMIANLLDNAIRHSPPQTRIALSMKRAVDGATAEVSDQGPGIPAGEHEKIFERFYRLDSSRATEGNGLGLALVSAVAALHGIKIALEDNQPGLKVVLRFPAP